MYIAFLGYDQFHPHLPLLGTYRYILLKPPARETAIQSGSEASFRKKGEDKAVFQYGIMITTSYPIES